METERLNNVWLVGATWWQGCRELLLHDNCFCKAMAVSQAFIFQFKCYSILHFAVCQLQYWAFFVIDIIIQINATSYKDKPIFLQLFKTWIFGCIPPDNRWKPSWWTKTGYTLDVFICDSSWYYMKSWVRITDSMNGHTQICVKGSYQLVSQKLQHNFVVFRK